MKKKALISLALLCPTAGDLQAQGRWDSLALTVTGGGYSFDSSQGADTGILSGFKIGYGFEGTDLRNTLTLEAVFHYLAASGLDGSLIRADAVYPLVKMKKIVPFLAIGAGYISLDEKSGSDGAPIVSYGGGLQYFLRNYLVLRADLRHNIWFDAGRMDNVEYTAGLSYLFGKEREKKPVPPPDADGDAVPDRQDRCPDTPKGLIADRNGCPIDPPDSDGDAVPDYLERCPDTPKGVRVGKDGCPPDSDGDGVPDRLDQCPATVGLEVEETGCVKIPKEDSRNDRPL